VTLSYGTLEHQRKASPATFIALH